MKELICSSIRMNLKVRGTSKNSSVRTNKSNINELRKELIKNNEKRQMEKDKDCVKK